MMEDKLFEAIVSNLDIGVAIYDAQGNFLYVNPKMVQWRKVSYQQYLSMNVHDFFGEDSDECVFDLVMRSRQISTRLQYYQAWQPSSPAPHKLRIVTGVPIFDKDGNIRNVIAYLQDVEEYNEKLAMLSVSRNDILRMKEVHSQRGGAPGDDIIMESPQMKDLFSYAYNVARTDAAVLLTGESGTGKEVLAHYIYRHSLRSDRPLVEVNCAAFAESLLESELFGYEKGSFTGALSTGKKGLVEAADGGTLFLDEINSLPLALQGKFLRLIENKTYRRVGSNTIRHADFRLIVATNANLRTMVDEGTFRADLYYRLNVIPLRLPPLRDRKEDIIPFCNLFIRQASEEYGMQKAFSQKATARLCAYDWPGNIRELKNFIERLVIMTSPDTAVIENIPMDLFEQSVNVRSSGQKAPARKKLTRDMVLSALEACNGNRERTALYLGISKRTLQYKIKEFDLPHKEIQPYTAPRETEGEPSDLD